VEIAFHLVDVFCERPFAGNQLCVVSEAAGMDDATMQMLAREIGFSETTFVTETGTDGYRMRIFSPEGEMPFAGHPTLGTAFVMTFEGRVRSPLTQVVPAGEIRVEVDLDRGGARMRLLPPALGPEFSDLALASAAASLTPGDLHPELPPQVVGVGYPLLVVPVRDLDTLRAAQRDARAVRALADASGAEFPYLFALTEEGATARMFDPGEGIGEDPATGSAAGPLGAYLAARGAGGLPGRIEVRQGEQVGRPSVLRVDVQPEGDSWVVHVGGGVAIVGDGRFRL
jgi:trans-2,3-dihydro-3-hydroxyanthranilate isomerase